MVLNQHKFFLHLILQVSIFFIGYSIDDVIKGKFSSMSSDEMSSLSLDVLDCFSNNLSSKSSFLSDTSPLQPFFHYNSTDPVILIGSIVIDRYDVHRIEVLTDCTRELIPEKFEDRQFDDGGYGGGNNVTFINGFAQQIIPDIIGRLKDVVAQATKYAGWTPDPLHMGIRCVETLHYSHGGELYYHEDTGSIYTAVFMLSDASDYEGGSFSIYASSQSQYLNETVDIRMDMGKGIVFDSLVGHGVKPITKGTRKVLVFEFWEYIETNEKHFRPSPADVGFKGTQTSLVKGVFYDTPDLRRNVNLRSVCDSQYFVGFSVGFSTGLCVTGVVWFLSRRSN